jgi:hypothetical protein
MHRRVETKKSKQGGTLSTTRETFSAFLFAVIATSLAMVACAANEIKWTEEVKLSDGRVIQLQRRVELTASGFPVQQRGVPNFYELCYPPMKVHWKSQRGYQPDVFDIVGGKAYVQVPITGCYECRVLGDPDPNALFFVWDSGKWKRIRYEEFPQSAQWNLLLSIVSPAGHEENDPRGLVTLQDKEQRPSSLRNEQRRLGWKRTNESYESRDACKKCGRTGSNLSFDPAPDIFVHDGVGTCGQ